jgi:hypothetical protein
VTREFFEDCQRPHEKFKHHQLSQNQVTFDFANDASQVDDDVTIDVEQVKITQSRLANFIVKVVKGPS